MWLAPPRAYCALPEYTARKLWWAVDGEGVICRSKAKERSCLAPRRQPPNVIRNRDHGLAHEVS
jgi:hypothetical protein